MEALHAYGTKDGKEVLIFQQVANTPASRQNMRETAAARGYEITRVYKSGDNTNGYADTDITAEFKAEREPRE